MSNFGVMDLRLVNAYEVAFREARSAVKASTILQNAREYATVADAVADCALIVGTSAVGPRTPDHPVKRLELGGRMIARKLAAEPVALLFGSEKFGLSNDDLAHCHWLMRIPTREEHGSMNLGQSVAVCLYEIMRSPIAARAKPDEKAAARAEDLNRIYDLLAEILEYCDYIHERTGDSMYLKLRRLLHRMELSRQDAVLWLGILRKIKWKLLS